VQVGDGSRCRGFLGDGLSFEILIWELWFLLDCIIFKF
jgi:hypothetical protein